MLTRDEYENLKARSAPVVICYHYWLEHKKRDYEDLSQHEFVTKFTKFLKDYMDIPIRCPNSEVKMCTHDSILDKVFSHYDNKFGYENN